MAPLSSLPKEPFVKFMYVGDSGSGKTGSLVSLVKAGYKLKILDMDNGFSILRAFVKHECPELMGNVDVETFRDTYTVRLGGDLGVVGSPKAFTSAIKLLNKWSDGSTPSEWGADTIFVLDTLTTLGKAAMAWAEGLNPLAKDPRQWYGAAQAALEKLMATIMGPEFKTNVIVSTHIAAREVEGAAAKGFPTAGAGKALDPTLAKYVNTLVLAESTGFGANVKRKIKTLPNGFIDLKTAAPFGMAAEYPLETGLATIFNLLKDN